MEAKYSKLTKEQIEYRDREILGKMKKSNVAKLDQRAFDFINSFVVAISEIKQKK